MYSNCNCSVHDDHPAVTQTWQLKLLRRESGCLVAGLMKHTREQGLKEQQSGLTALTICIAVKSILLSVWWSQWLFFCVLHSQPLYHSLCNILCEAGEQMFLREKHILYTDKMRLVFYFHTILNYLCMIFKISYCHSLWNRIDKDWNMNLDIFYYFRYKIGSWYLPHSTSNV